MPVQALQHPHMGLGYLLAILGLVVCFWAIWQTVNDQEMDGVAGVVTIIYVGLLDLQVLLGIGLFFLMGYHHAIFSFWIHPVCMIGAAVLGHVARKTTKWTMTGMYGFSFILLLIGVFRVTRFLQ